MSYNQAKLNDYRTQLCGKDRCYSPFNHGKTKQSINTLSDEDNPTSCSRTFSTIHSSSPPETIGTFVCPTCPYCSGARDPTVKFIHSSTKPGTPEEFWNHVVRKKYRNVQSKAGKENMAGCFSASSSSVTERASAGEKTEERKGRDKMFVVGPMVDQSELPFRLLCREYGATLTYTPMLHAQCFLTSDTYRRQYLTTTPLDEVIKFASVMTSNPVATKQTFSTDHADGCEERGEKQVNSPEGMCEEEEIRVDRPVFVQFCGSKADTILEAARLAVRGVHCGSKLSRKYSSDGSSDSSCSSTRESSSNHSLPVNLPDLVMGEDELEMGWYKECNGERYYHCDAVDLNLGCPQGIARRGHYGSFLMEEWDTIHTILHTLHCELEVPVTAKIRVFDEVDGGRLDESLTLAYIKMILDAGASVVCIHGRTRAMKGQSSGLADMEFVKRLCEATTRMMPMMMKVKNNGEESQRSLHKAHDSNNNNAPNSEDNNFSFLMEDLNSSHPCYPSARLTGKVPILTNGNVLCFDDVALHLSQIGADGHMCAEPLLWNPSLFKRGYVPSGRLHCLATANMRLLSLQHAKRYLWYVRQWPVSLGMAKAHLFKMLYWLYEEYPEMRVALSMIGSAASPQHKASMPKLPLVTPVSKSFMETIAPLDAPYRDDHHPNVCHSSANNDNFDIFSGFATALENLEKHVAELTLLEEESSIGGSEKKETSSTKMKGRKKTKEREKTALPFISAYNWFASSEEDEYVNDLFGGEE